MVPTRHKSEGDHMDVDSFQRHGDKDSKGGKDGKSGLGGTGGKKVRSGKQQAFDGYCNKYGNKEADCWSKAPPSLAAQGNKDSIGGKGSRGKKAEKAARKVVDTAQRVASREVRA